MKVFLKFFAILLAIVFASAFLAPLLAPWLPFKFERIFNRLVMIFTLVAIVLFVRVRRSSFAHYGFIKGANTLPETALMFLGGVGILAVLAGIRLAAGQAVWAPRGTDGIFWLKEAVLALGSGIVIGIIEEFFFRGFVFRSLRDKIHAGTAASLAVTNLFYALIHFVDIKKPFIPPDPTFNDSLLLAAAPFESLLQLPLFWPGAVGLFLFGMILSMLYLRTGNLWASIGLHAGCVFFVKFDGSFVDYTLSTLWTGTAKLYDGILGWALLGALGVIGWCMTKRPLRAPPGIP